MNFNINETVRVKLNGFGFAILENRYDELMAGIPKFSRKFEPPKVDATGHSKFQMWDLMSTFGTYMALGGQQPFDSRIIIPIKPSSGDLVKRLRGKYEVGKGSGLNIPDRDFSAFIPPINLEAANRIEELEKEIESLKEELKEVVSHE